MNDSRIVISGASGLIGGELTRSLRADGIRVVHLVRRPARSGDEVEWLTDGPLDPDVLAGATAVVNLNGASIGRLPWGARYRRTLRQSRLQPTSVLADALLAMNSDAPALLSASAVGYYGDQPGVRLDETAAPGETFLAELCVEWEREAMRAAAVTRVALLRTAPILHPDAVLKPMIPLTRFGLGGPLGSGRQVWPWISLDDEVRAIRHVIDSDVHGPVNLTGPHRATAGGIGRTLASLLHRPYLIPAPAWALRLGLGRAAADSLLLADADAVPDALSRSGFAFRHPTAPDALAAALD
ncbi:TIGR01777 family oxidoreductase [Microbacterium sp.]|uniref:TIGR01777 family oxidoreductase n=1 Tax=Microbacterium sp. TaxID=51671 RepID=UPI0028B04871|nr:TIGR01777 family oxidoreductase [Microbacterium sp.]